MFFFFFCGFFYKSEGGIVGNPGFWTISAALYSIYIVLAAPKLLMYLSRE